MTITDLIFRKRGNFLFPAKGTSESKVAAATLAKNVEAYGYRFTRKAFNRLATLSRPKLAKFYAELVPVIAEARGAHRKFEPMYPNFPEQVMELDAFELYINALIHYWTLMLPDYDKEKREALQETVKYDLIDIGAEKDVTDIFKALLGAKAPLSTDDKEIMAWIITEQPAHAGLPAKIPLKENLAIAIGAFYRVERNDAVNALVAKTNNPTDVMRVAAVLCDGDVSLAEGTTFKKMSRATRRFLLACLEPMADLAELMAPKRSQWLRLGEALHPGEFHKVFPNAAAAFVALRADKRVPTYGTRVETAVAAKDIPKAIVALAARPGDFIRRLDALFRAGPDDAFATWSAFKKTSSAVSSRVLLQAYGHFLFRNGDSRIVFPKGSTAKTQVIAPLPALPAPLIKKVVVGLRKELVRRYSRLPALGKVFIDPTLADFAVPFSQRSAAKALRTIPRGSRLPLIENFTRLFVWWKNCADDRVDIDLSVVLFDSVWNRVGDCSYMTLARTGLCHSGDITNAPNGACEFIDIDRKLLVNSGARYAIMCVNSFSQQPYKDLPECFAGWMERAKPQNGEIFEARTVKQKFDLAGDTAISIPVIIDLTEGKVLWCDLALSKRPMFPNNVRSNKNGILTVCRGMWESKKLSLLDLLSLHVEARGTAVDALADAETVFDAGTTPFQIDTVVAEYL